jgi:hypothetical protein
MHALTLRRHGKRGVNTFIIRLPRMPAAHCIATMTARDAHGRRRRAHKVGFVVRALG